ncbi:MAG: (Fe-S)-binding protein [Actinobacteria bacterium]|jgi:Fe-S oxidoreductase|nr:MAG: (Fe-S)-binding protein [Actinomycetota bacterium]
MPQDPGMYDFFHYEDCDLCGDCLVRCQYMDLNRSEAVEEMKRLIAGEPTRVVHKKCISCYACDAFCPRGCRPYELILKTWHERYRERGLPVRASYLMPASSPNFRTDILKRMNVRERELLRVWREAPPEGEAVLYPGCSVLTLPHLLDAGFMRGVTVSGDFDLCCGEMYFRQGLFDVVERVAEKLTTYYRGRDIGTMLFACPAGLNMFRNVLPGQFGAEFDFGVEYLGTYLLEKLESGEIEIVKKLHRSVAVHDSCHARILGSEIMDTARSLYALMGLEMREMEHNREEGFCCGFAAGCNRYSPTDMVLASIRELWEAQKTGAREMAIYCTACLTTMTMYRWLFPTPQPLRHLLEYLKEATGEMPRHPAQKRSFFMLANIARKAFPQIPSRKTYRIDI